jgi:hypothetical protein
VDRDVQDAARAGAAPHRRLSPFLLIVASYLAKNYFVSEEAFWKTADLSRQMGGDSEAMASIITWTTLLSAITITFIVGTVAL